MTSAQAMAEVFWTAFRALPKKGREVLIQKLLQDKEFREDFIDLAIIQRRRNEPSRRLDEYLVDKRKKKV